MAVDFCDLGSSVVFPLSPVKCSGPVRFRPVFSCRLPAYVSFAGLPVSLSQAGIRKAWLELVCLDGMEIVLLLQIPFSHLYLLVSAGAAERPFIRRI